MGRICNDTGRAKGARRLALHRLPPFMEREKVRRILGNDGESVRDGVREMNGVVRPVQTNVGLRWPHHSVPGFLEEICEEVGVGTVVKI
jgi:hypothetical protein